MIENFPLYGQAKGPRPAIWEITEGGWIKRDGLLLGKILAPHMVPEAVIAQGITASMSVEMDRTTWQAFLADVCAGLTMREQDLRIAAADRAEQDARLAKLAQRKVAEKHLASPAARRRSRKTP